MAPPNSAVSHAATHVVHPDGRVSQVYPYELSLSNRASGAGQHLVVYTESPLTSNQLTFPRPPVQPQTWYNDTGYGESAVGVNYQDTALSYFQQLQQAQEILQAQQLQSQYMSLYRIDPTYSVPAPGQYWPEAPSRSLNPQAAWFQPVNSFVPDPQEYPPLPPANDRRGSRQDSAEQRSAVTRPRAGTGSTQSQRHTRARQRSQSHPAPPAHPNTGKRTVSRPLSATILANARRKAKGAQYRNMPRSRLATADSLDRKRDKARPVAELLSYLHRNRHLAFPSSQATQSEEQQGETHSEGEQDDRSVLDADKKDEEHDERKFNWLRSDKASDHWDELTSLIFKTRTAWAGQTSEYNVNHQPSAEDRHSWTLRDKRWRRLTEQQIKGQLPKSAVLWYDDLMRDTLGHTATILTGARIEVPNESDGAAYTKWLDDIHSWYSTPGHRTEANGHLATVQQCLKTLKSWRKEKQQRVDADKAAQQQLQLQQESTAARVVVGANYVDPPADAAHQSRRKSGKDRMGSSTAPPQVHASISEQPSTITNGETRSNWAAVVAGGRSTDHQPSTVAAAAGPAASPSPSELPAALGVSADTAQSWADIVAAARDDEFTSEARTPAKLGELRTAPFVQSESFAVPKRHASRGKQVSWADDDPNEEGFSGSEIASDGTVRLPRPEAASSAGSDMPRRADGAAAVRLSRPEAASAAGSAMPRQTDGAAHIGGADHPVSWPDMITEDLTDRSTASETGEVRNNKNAGPAQPDDFSAVPGKAVLKLRKQITVVPTEQQQDGVENPPTPDTFAADAVGPTGARTTEGAADLIPVNDDGASPEVGDSTNADVESDTGSTASSVVFHMGVGPQSEADLGVNRDSDPTVDGEIGGGIRAHEEADITGRSRDRRETGDGESAKDHPGEEDMAEASQGEAPDVHQSDASPSMPGLAVSKTVLDMEGAGGSSMRDVGAGASGSEMSLMDGLHAALRAAKAAQFDATTATSASADQLPRPRNITSMSVSDEHDTAGGRGEEGSVPKQDCEVM